MKNEIIVKQKSINESLSQLNAKSASTIDEWKQIGQLLAAARSSVSWAIGDWLRLGEGAGYLPRGKLDEAATLVELSKKRLMNIAGVCKSFESARRREDLSFGHHEQVAGRSDADRLLEWASKNRASVAELRQQMLKKPLPTNAVSSSSTESADKSNPVERQQQRKLGRKRLVTNEPPLAPTAPSRPDVTKSDPGRLQTPPAQNRSALLNVCAETMQQFQESARALSPPARLKFIVELVRGGTDAARPIDVGHRLGEVILALDLAEEGRMRCMMTLAHGLSQTNRGKVIHALWRIVSGDSA